MPTLNNAVADACTNLRNAAQPPLHHAPNRKMMYCTGTLIHEDASEGTETRVGWMFGAIHAQPGSLARVRFGGLAT